MTQRVLIVLHRERSNPGRVAQELRRRGCTLDIRRPALGDPLPETMESHDAAIIFGGPMSANDDLPFIHAEMDWISVPLREEKPYLGICLGAQLLAKSLGARVYGRADERCEVGYFPIRPTADGTHLFDDPQYVYQWHREGFDLPRGATLLAAGRDFEAQAFRYGPATYGLQFHPEVTYAMMCRWTLKASVQYETLPGAYPRDSHLAGWYRHDRATAQWLGAFLTAWLLQGAAGCDLNAS